ncbi:DUF5009 domain-containing protein [bacterium]|nr:DUF5009 domain-containing protein [bacterium]
MKTNSGRLVSLDVFRGLTIAAMILVNHPGSWQHVYAPLRHAEWHGWTPTDLVFPFFLFIMGASIKLSMDKYLKSGKPKASLLPRIFRRTILLFLFGLILNGFPDYNFNTLRIPGVLQRIAGCYLIISLIYLARVRMAGDRLYFSPRFIMWLGLGFMVLYCGLMRFVPVPGYGAGLWDSKEGNLAAYVDRWVFGPHLWRFSKTWDPEGLLSTLPALATTISGLICAWWLRLQHQNRMQKLMMLFVAGTAGVLLGYLLSLIVPINKNLWTPSYVFLTSGLALGVLGICMWLVDVKGWTRWSKSFQVLGSNAILVYFLSSLGGRVLSMIKVGGTSLASLIYQFVCTPVFGDMLGSLVFAILYVLLWTGLMAILYVHRVFVRV